MLLRIPAFVKTETLKLLYEETIQPVTDYACSVWCHIKKSNLNKLQRVWNYAARIISGNFDYIDISDIDLLRFLSNCIRTIWLVHRSSYFKVFKTIRGLTPTSTNDNIVMAIETHAQDTRLSNSYDDNIPPHNSDVLERLFIYNDRVILKTIPAEIRIATDVTDFKLRYKCFILNPLFEIGWYPLACKLTDNHIHRVHHFILMSSFWFIYMCVFSVVFYFIVSCTILYGIV